MALTVKPLHEQIGAEIIGLDLGPGLDDATFSKIREMFHQYQILVFRNQDLTDDEYVSFARRFGKLELFVDASMRAKNKPEIARLTNLDENGTPYGPCPKMETMSLAENWHTDSSYRQVPSMATLLYGVIVPSVGGDTQFVNMYSVYDQLPPTTRERIAALEAEHSWEYQRGLVTGWQPLSAEERASAPPATHKLVQRHPETGRKSLYISSSAHGIQAMEQSEARTLLDELAGIATREGGIYTHKWRPGDVMIWDNRCTLHRSAGFDYQSTVHRRMLKRIIVAGAEAG
jgi:alpha-ketoglutarate-dependent taurine dioxygenase